MSFTINAVSFNVGSFNDWQNLSDRAELEIKDGTKFCLESMRNKEGFLNRLDEARTKARGAFEGAHKELVKDKLTHLINQFDPDVFCLQEYFPNVRYEVLKQLLEEKGYVVVGVNDLAIVYKKSAFEIIGNAAHFTFDEDKTAAVQAGFSDVRPALFADLKHKKSGKIVRVVTDHVKGFDGPVQKEATAQRRLNNAEKVELSGQHVERAAAFLDQIKLHQPVAKGDLALDLSLEAIETREITYHKPTGRLAKWASYIADFFRPKPKMPDLIIYGLDSNTTAKYVSQNKEDRLHPKRIRLFEMHGYARDPLSIVPTIRDGNSARPVKYDYIHAKAFSDKVQVTVRDFIEPGINDVAMLDKPAELMSDHLPVLSAVAYEKQASWLKRLFCFVR